MAGTWGEAGRTKFFWRLWGSYASIILLVTLALSLLINQFFTREAERTLQAKLGTIADLAAAMVSSNPKELWTGQLQLRLSEVCGNTRTTADIILASGEFMLQTNRGRKLVESALQSTEFLAAGSKGSGESRYKIDGGEVYVYSVRPVIIQSEKIGYVRIGSSTEEVIARTRSLKGRVGIGAFAISALSLFLGLPLARSATRPLKTIETACRRISEGDLSLRLDLDRRDEFGEVARSVNHMAESIESQIAQQERQSKRLELLLRLLNDSVVAIDRAGSIVFMNAAAESLLAVREEDARGSNYRETFHIGSLLGWIDEARESGDQRLGEVQWGDGKGKRFASVYIAPLRRDDHDIVGALIVVRDVTEGRRFEELRRDFSSNVSHELKTPVAAITTLLDALEEGADSDADLRKKFLSRLRIQNERLQRLIEELLAISKLESANSYLECATVDLREIVRSVRTTFETFATLPGVNFSVFEGSEPIEVSCDARLIEIAINSLVENAFKFTSKGGSVTVDLKTDAEFAFFEVRDTGVGIARESLDRIFERFYRVESSRSRQQGGSGLGLSIVKHVAEAHGGEITVESEFEKGSVFRLRIPKDSRVSV